MRWKKLFLCILAVANVFIVCETLSRGFFSMLYAEKKCYKCEEDPITRKFKCEQIFWPEENGASRCTPWPPYYEACLITLDDCDPYPPI
ncbi:MAG: hypothetical protein ACYDH0_04710 [Candidatus Aminicenantales bacterium]